MHWFRVKWGATFWSLWLAALVLCCSSGGGDPHGEGAAGAGGEAGASSETNRAPTADAGPAQIVDVDSVVTLDGSDSTDPDGDKLTFEWAVTSQPVGAAVELSDTSAVRPTFTLSKAGSYVFELVVRDAELSSEPARVSVSTSGNRAPIANAGDDLAVKVGEEATLDGSQSMDPDGDSITYAWKLTSKPDDSDAKLSDPAAIAPSFDVDVDGDYRFELIVNDGALDSEPASVVVSTGNLPPRAEIAALEDRVLVDEPVLLDGSGSHDANGDALTYHWSISSQPEGSVATLEAANEAKATLIPDRRGDYVVQLVVNDGSVDSVPVTLLAVPDNRKPVAAAGADQVGEVGQSLALDGSGSTDPDHDDLHYAWTLASSPTGSAAQLADASSATPTLVGDLPGDYAVELAVNDGELTSKTDSVTISVTAAGLGPKIGGFSPVAGPAGTLVTVTGSGFVSADGVVHVYVTTASGVVEATVVSVTDTEVKFILPPGATTGTFTVQVGDQKLESSTPLTIQASSKFELGVEPSSVALSPGVSVSAIVRLATSSGFADLAELGVEGLPNGITASFTPQKIRAGDWSLLTLRAASDSAATQLELTVRASAEIDSASHSELGSLSVAVQPITTAFVGRTVLDDSRESPLAGVTVTWLGKDGNAGSTNCQGTTVSDAAGNFAFTNLPVGCTSTQLVRYDGLTTTSPEGKYAGVDLANAIAPGVATEAAALVHLPRVDTAPTVGVKQNSATDQVLSFEGIPDMTVTVYAGTTLTMPDGTTPDPFPLTAIPIPVDRLPEEVPQNQAGFHFFVVAFQPAAGLASQPIAVSYPNQLAFPPGTAMKLLTLDPDRGVMVEYGDGKVSDDGLQIVPDADPKHPGHRYGIVHLDWHLPFSFLEPLWKWITEPCPSSKTNKSVDFATGLEQHIMPDIGIDGPRGSIGIVRRYRTGNPNVGPFGIGTSHNYHYQLNTAALTGTTFNLIDPNGNVVPFARQADATYVNKTDTTFAGAVFRSVSGGSQLRMMDGTLLGFQPFSRMGGSMLTSITDPNGNAVTLTRAAGTPFAITAVTDPAGRDLLLTYDAAGRVTQITDPLNRKVTYAYVDGLLSTVTGVGGTVTKYAYTAKGELASITDSRNVKLLQLSYDANGRVISETGVGTGTTKFEYTVINERMPKSPVVQTKVTDALGSVALYRFNPQGYLLSTTDPLGQTNTWTREAGTNRILETQGSGSCGSCASPGHQVFEYNAVGQVIKETDEVGATTQTEYESTLGRPSSLRDALGNVTKLDYDARGNLTRITDAFERTSSFEYDANGQIVAVVDVDGQRATLAYDGVGNLVATTDPAGNVQRMQYDAASRLIATVDPLGRRSVTRYDDANHIVEIVDGSGASTKFAYDEIGNLTTVTDARGAVTRYAYDEAGRVITRTDPLGASADFVYDETGRLINQVSRRGLKASFAYDALGRVTSTTYVDSSVQYRYDAAGNVAGVVDTLAGEYVFSHDARNLVTGVQGPSGSLSYSYDLLGRVRSEAVLGQPATTFSYNATGQYSRIETDGAGVSFEYDKYGRLLNQTRDNGVVTQYQYDGLGALVGIRHRQNSSEIDAQAYESDATGSTTHGEGSAMGALQTAEVTASYDLANRIVSWGGKTFTHDADGNRLTASVDGLGESYTWDARGRLQSITKGDGTVVRLSYDYAGNLTRLSSANGDETQLTGLSGNVILRRTRDGTIQRLLSGQAMDHQLALLDSKRGVRYPLLSAANSTVATVDGEGLVDGQFSYEPFGAMSVLRDSEADYPFAFTGRTQVTKGLYYYRARYYDPLTSRFLSEDPAGELGGFNLYQYAGSNPVSRVDPSGKFWIPLVLIVGTAAYKAISAGIKGCSSGAIARAALFGAVEAAVTLAMPEFKSAVWISRGLTAGVGSAAGTAVGDGLWRASNGEAWHTDPEYWQGIGVSAVFGGALAATKVAEHLIPTRGGGHNFDKFTSPRTFGPKATQLYVDAGLNGFFENGQAVGDWWVSRGGKSEGKAP